jgi:hypothetical protein
MRYTVVEALQKNKTEKGFYWVVKATGEDGKEYTGDLWKATQPEAGKSFTADLTMTNYGQSFKNVVWEGEEKKKSYVDNRAKYDFSKEEKIENDKKTSERIARQGFMQVAVSLFPNYKGDVDKWLADIRKIEPIFREYLSSGEL